MESEQDLLKIKIRLERRKVITNIILIIVLSIIAIYVIMEIENFKTLGSDVCMLCEQKANAVCISNLDMDRRVLSPAGG